MRILRYPIRRDFDAKPHPHRLIVPAVDTSKKDLPLDMAEASEATVTGEPGRTFRAKRDYEEGGKLVPPADQERSRRRQRLCQSRRRSRRRLHPWLMSLWMTMRKGESLCAFDVDTTDAADEELFPLGSSPWAC